MTPLSQGSECSCAVGGWLSITAVPLDTAAERGVGLLGSQASKNDPGVKAEIESALSVQLIPHFRQFGNSFFSMVIL